MDKKPIIKIPDPELQIDFSYALSQIRTLYLQQALSETVENMNISDIDREFADMVPGQYLSALARHGLRGELVFPVPCILEQNPRLLGYYRLLLGFSQKAFYSAAFGASSFKQMEDRGELSRKNRESLSELCAALILSASKLVDGIGSERISRELLDDLTLLTLGPQLRGGANVKIGTTSIIKVFEIIHNIVEKFTLASNPSRIEIHNAAGRTVLIEFAPDPDIIIREEIAPGTYRNIIAIEVKGGTDFSNIHNRLGEAEKSHQKARQQGYVECWTVVNVDRINVKTARQESPSTNRFYLLSDLVAGKGSEFEDFRNRIISLTGIPNPV